MVLSEYFLIKYKIVSKGLSLLCTVLEQKFSSVNNDITTFTARKHHPEGPQAPRLSLPSSAWVLDGRRTQRASLAAIDTSKSMNVAVHRKANIK